MKALSLSCMLVLFCAGCSTWTTSGRDWEYKTIRIDYARQGNNVDLQVDEMTRAGWEMIGFSIFPANPDSNQALEHKDSVLVGFKRLK